MEKNPSPHKLTSLLSPYLLKTTRFGKSKMPLVWVAAPSILQVAECLKKDTELALDWLENLSVVELEGVFMVSYFLRSRKTPYRLIVRLSEVATKSNERVSIPSAQTVWPMAAPFEKEIQELFGFSFKNSDGSLEDLGQKLLPEGLKGFPLRKDFHFPLHDRVGKGGSS